MARPTQDDFEVFTVRPKKAVRNSEGVRVVEDYTDAEWDEAKAGAQEIIDNYDVNSFATIREYRNKLLNDSDWALVSDTTLTESELVDLKAWRTSLRDLPASQEDPDDIVFPACPIDYLGIEVFQPLA